MKILIAAEEAAGVQTLKTVTQSQHNIVAVLTQNKVDSTMRGATVATVAEHLGLPVWPARLVKRLELVERIKEAQVDLLLNVHSLYIIRAEVLDAVRVGAFNLHPGRLPHYAGMNAPSWAIFNGEAQHGVTLHWMEAGIDTGHIAYQAVFDLKPSDTGLSVSSQCVRQGLPLIQELLSDPDNIPKIAQDISQRHYYGFEVPFGGVMAWQQPAQVLERFVRACDYYPLPSPWGYPKAWLNKSEFGLMKVRLSQQSCSAAPGSIQEIDGSICVATADEWLCIERILRDGKAVKPEGFLKAGQQLIASPIE